MIAAASLIPTWGDRIAAIVYLCLLPGASLLVLRWASHPHPRNRKDHS